MTDTTTSAAVDPQLVRELAQQAIAEMAFRYDAVGSVLAARGLDRDQYAAAVIAHIDAATIQVSWPDERPQQERGGDGAAARIQAFTDAWTDVPGMEGLVAGLGIPTRLDLTIDDLRAVLAELERLRAERDMWANDMRNAFMGGWTLYGMSVSAVLDSMGDEQRDKMSRDFLAGYIAKRSAAAATPQQPEPSDGAS